MYNDGYTWDLDPNDKMVIVIKLNGDRVMSIYLGEAIESAGYHAVMNHIDEINRSPWIHAWHSERKAEVVKILKE
jgi:hypothetical protein